MVETILEQCKVTGGSMVFLAKGFAFLGLDPFWRMGPVFVAEVPQQRDLPKCQKGQARSQPSLEFHATTMVSVMGGALSGIGDMAGYVHSSGKLEKNLWLLFNILVQNDMLDVVYVFCAHAVCMCVCVCVRRMVIVILCNHLDRICSRGGKTSQRYPRNGRSPENRFAEETNPWLPREFAE